MESQSLRQLKKPFYNSKKWKDTRDAYRNHRRAVDGGLCEICRQAAGTTAHHVTPITRANIDDPTVTLSHDNLKWVCDSCHFLTEKVRINKHNPKFRVTNGSYIDDDGNLQQQRIVIVWGAPYAGKAAYVRTNKEDGDFVVDFSAIMQAVSFGLPESFPDALFGHALDIRDHMYNKIQNGEINAKTVWVIETAPTVKRRGQLAKLFPTAEFVFVDKTQDYCVCAVECNADVIDKARAEVLIAKWFDAYEC